MEDKEMKKEEIIKRLKKVRNEVGRKYKAQIKGIFGSYVRGEEKEGSDVDILVEFRDGASFLNLVGLANFLEERLNNPVDIVPADTIRKEIKEQILREVIYL